MGMYMLFDFTLYEMCSGVPVVELEINVVGKKHPDFYCMAISWLKGVVGGKLPVCFLFGCKLPGGSWISMGLYHWKTMQMLSYLVVQNWMIFQKFRLHQLRPQLQQETWILQLLNRQQVQGLTLDMQLVQLGIHYRLNMLNLFGILVSGGVFLEQILEGMLCLNSSGGLYLSRTW